MQGATGKLAQFASDFTYESIPSAVVQETKRLILDTIGCAIGGVHTESGRIALEHVREYGGKPAATVVGTGERNSVPHAAYANARLGNVLDADDTFPTGTHFGSPTIFAALAQAESQRRSGRDLITAVAVGFDIGARIGSSMGLAIKLEDGKVAGWPKVLGTSATMTWGAVGAAASVARLGRDKTCEAFGIAGANTSLPALRKYTDAKRLPMYKYSDAGWSAQTAVSAIQLARLGSTGYFDILDGDLGFWRFYGAQTCDFDVMLEELGSHWHILDTTYKPWPSCRWTHYPLTAFLNLKVEHGLHPDEIDRVVVKGSPFAQSYRFKLNQPDNMMNAEYSNAHVLAMVAHDVPPGPLWYVDEWLSGQRIRDFRERVTVELEPRSADLVRWMEKGQFRRVPGGVEVHARGKIFTKTVEMALGDPWSKETRLSDEALHQKFVGMVCGIWPDSDERRRMAEQILLMLDRLEDLSDVGELCRLLVTDKVSS